MLRNPRLARPWLKALARGCRLAQDEKRFARTSGSFFGGLDIRSLDIIGEVWTYSIKDALEAWPRFLARFSGIQQGPRPTTVGDLVEWNARMLRSALADPAWHAAWLTEMQDRWPDVLASAPAGGEADPRASGLPARLIPGRP